MSQLKRRKTDNTFEVVGDKSMPIRYLADGTPTDDDYIVFDAGTGARKATVQDLIDSATGNVAQLSYTVVSTWS